MTQEEKAKAYDEALEKAKDTLQKSSAKDAAKTIVYHFFPELKESEDEIIRKELIDFFSDKDESDYEGLHPRTEIVAWLEKQGEQKPMTEEFEHELAEICNQLLSEIDSEWMNNEILDCIGTSVWLNLCGETAKRYKDGLLKLAKQGEQKPAEWGEEDEKHIDSLLERLEGMCKKGATFTKTRFAISQDMDWLKSLKERIGG